MSIRADIDWIKTELDKIDDPLLIGRVKSLLRDRDSKPDLEAERMILEALENVKKGNLFTSEEVDKKIEQWVQEK